MNEHTTYEDNLFSQFTLKGKINDSEKDVYGNYDVDLKGDKPPYCDGAFDMAVNVTVKKGMEKGLIGVGEEFTLSIDVLANEEGQLGFSATIEE